MAMAQYGDALTADVNTSGVSPSAPTQSTAPTLPPGIGNAAQANQASQFMRAQPWYQDFLKQQGQDPNHVKLTKDQSYQLLQLARQKGVGISTKYSLDSSGNIVSEGMPGWEKAAIIAGVVVGGYFLAPAVIAAFGSEAAATSAATAAAAGDTSAAAALTSAGATLASTTTAPLMTGTIAGSVASGAVPAALAAGGAAAAVPVATLASNAAIPAAASDVGAGAAYGAEGAAPLASATLPTATGTVAGGTGLTAAGTAGDGSLLGGVGGAAGAASAVGGMAGGGSLAGDLLRYGVPTAGNIVGGLIQANAAGSAADKQQKYLEEALSYEKQRDAAAIALEGSRYANYSGNIAPYLATGNSANTRMASLLGLPSTAATAKASTPAPTFTPTPGSNPGQVVTPPGTVVPGLNAPTPTRPAAVTTQPVMMRAPDGSTQQVPPEQVAHFQSRGAQVVNA